MDFGGDPLGWLLGSDDSQSFLSTYYAKRHYLARNDQRGRFMDLLSFEELDHILGTYGLKFPEIRLARADQDVPLSEYTYRSNIADPLRIARLFAEGATVIFRGLQDRHKHIQLLCSALAQQATLQTQANIYLTPPQAQGFNIHWDTHDVFVIQIEGSKDWRIYDGGIPLPIRSQKFDSKQYAPGDLLDQFTLHAGEVLYIPRGIMHAASATNEPSLHITLGFLGYSWAELLIDVLAEHTEKSIAWRENVPFGYGHGEHQGIPQLQEELAQRLQGLMEDVDINPVVHAHLWQVHAASRPRETRFLENAMHADKVIATDRVQIVPGMTWHLSTDANRVYLTGGARELAFPIIAKPMLETLIEGAPIALGDLDNRIDLDSRKTVVARLMREGLLRRVTH